MPTTAALTLAAEFWRRHRLGLASVATILAGYVIISAINPLPGRSAGIHTMFFVMGLAYVLGVFAYGFDGKLESPDSGFPVRLFVLPVRTTVLVAGPMIQAILLGVLLWVCWDRLVLRPAGLELPAWWTALIAAIIAASIALNWLPFGVPFLRILVMVAVLSALIRAPVVLEVIAGRISDPDRQARILTVAALALVPLSYLLALVGVGRARCGDAPTWQRASRSFPAASLQGTGRPFPSALRAQLWYEWRARGRGFVLVTALVVFALALLGALLEYNPEQRMNYGLVFLLMPLFLAASWGPYAGTAGAAARDRGGLSPFAATRPFNNAAFVAIKFAAALQATLIAWAVVLLMLILWWSYTGFPRNTAFVWERLADQVGVTRAAMGCALAAIAPIVLTWRTYAVGLTTGLTGRQWLVPAQTVLGFILFLQVMYEWTLWNADLARRERVLDVLPYFAAVLVVIKLALTAGLAATLARRDLLRRSTLSRLIAGWFLVAVGLFALLAWLVPGTIARTTTLALAAVLLLPLARPLAAPLALAWNRHR